MPLRPPLGAALPAVMPFGSGPPGMPAPRVRCAASGTLPCTCLTRWRAALQMQVMPSFGHAPFAHLPAGMPLHVFVPGRLGMPVAPPFHPSAAQPFGVGAATRPGGPAIGRSREETEREKRVAEAWAAYKAADGSGRTYYHNQLTGESSWERPQGFQGDEARASSNPVPVSSGTRGTSPPGRSRARLRRPPRRGPRPPAGPCERRARARHRVAGGHVRRRQEVLAQPGQRRDHVARAPRGGGEAAAAAGPGQGQNAGARAGHGRAAGTRVQGGCAVARGPPMRQGRGPAQPRPAAARPCKLRPRCRRRHACVQAAAVRRRAPRPTRTRT